MIDTCKAINKLNYTTNTFSSMLMPSTIECKQIALNFKKSGPGQKPCTEKQIDFVDSFQNTHYLTKENGRTRELYKSVADANRIVLDVFMFF